MIPMGMSHYKGSIVLKVQFDSTAVILTGDAEKEAERRIVARFGPELQADVLKVGHHGSYTSTTSKFLQAVNPEYAVISCGAGNTFGHPHLETLERLKEASVTIYRTDRDGTIVALSDGVRFYISNY